MKKIIALVLALVMVLSLGTVASASEKTIVTIRSFPGEYNNLGVTVANLVARALQPAAKNLSRVMQFNKTAVVNAVNTLAPVAFESAKNVADTLTNTICSTSSAAQFFIVAAKEKELDAAEKALSEAEDELDEVMEELYDNGWLVEEEIDYWVPAAPDSDDYYVGEPAEFDEQAYETDLATFYALVAEYESADDEAYERWTTLMELEDELYGSGSTPGIIEKFEIFRNRMNRVNDYVFEEGSVAGVAKKAVIIALTPLRLWSKYRGTSVRADILTPAFAGEVATLQNKTVSYYDDLALNMIRGLQFITLDQFVDQDIKAAELEDQLYNGTTVDEPSTKWYTPNDVPEIVDAVMDSGKNYAGALVGEVIDSISEFLENNENFEEINSYDKGGIVTEMVYFMMNWPWLNRK